jgi:hypothetical protein
VSYFGHHQTAALRDLLFYLGLKSNSRLTAQHSHLNNCGQRAGKSLWAMGLALLHFHAGQWGRWHLVTHGQMHGVGDHLVEQGYAQHVIYPVGVMDGQVLDVFRRNLLDVFAVFLQRIMFLMPARRAARIFSLMPPTGSTLPRSVISPVIARWLRILRWVKTEAMLVKMAMPALGPSLGTAPSGK